jgi:hypothetical protein
MCMYANFWMHPCLDDAKIDSWEVGPSLLFGACLGCLQVSGLTSLKLRPALQPTHVCTQSQQEFGRPSWLKVW